jgi:hypothetical protein
VIIYHLSSFRQAAGDTLIPILALITAGEISGKLCLIKLYLSPPRDSMRFSRPCFDEHSFWHRFRSCRDTAIYPHFGTRLVTLIPIPILALITAGEISGKLCLIKLYLSPPRDGRVRRKAVSRSYHVPSCFRATPRTTS